MKKTFKIVKKFTYSYIRSSLNSTTFTKNLIQNWAEDLNYHVFREDKQVVNKHRQNDSTWLNMRECKLESQWNTTSHNANTDENQPTEKNKHQESREIGTLLCCKLECKMMHAAAVENNVLIFLRLKNMITIWVSNCTFEFLPKRIEKSVFWRAIWTSKFIAVLFKIAKR